MDVTDARVKEEAERRWRTFDEVEMRAVVALAAASRVHTVYFESMSTMHT